MGKRKESLNEKMRSTDERNIQTHRNLVEMF
jgi:hypothetical protein